MGQGIGAADDLLEIRLHRLRLVEPAGFQTVRRVVLIWRDVNDIFLRLFRFCRGFRLDQLFPDGLGRFFLLRGRFCAARRADNENSGHCGREQLFHMQSSYSSDFSTETRLCKAG